MQVNIIKMKICSPNPSLPSAFTPRGGAACTSSRASHSLSRAADDPGEPGGEPGGVQAGWPDPWLSPEDATPSLTLWNGRRHKRSLWGQRTARESVQTQPQERFGSFISLMVDSGKKFCFNLNQ